MTLTLSKSKNATSLYVTKCVYKNGKRSSKIIEKLGTEAELSERLNGQDAIAWAKAYVAELNNKEEKEQAETIIRCQTKKLIEKDERRLLYGGYLFLQKIYHELRIDKICQRIAEKYNFEFNLNAVLSRLVYGRIIFPSSKLSTYTESKKFIEPQPFELQHIYRGLEILAKETDYIQTELYKHSTRITERKTRVLYYDCTNYFFEIEQEEGLKQYGYSKEHRPNPIVQMGLFMDGSGLPLAFGVNKGNTNEQTTLKPLEKKILKDFELSQIVVCTDAGLSSTANRVYNNMGGRAFITTQSVKQLKKHLKAWVLAPGGWRLSGKADAYNISELDEETHKAATFYKERWIKEDGLEQKLIVTYSIKYREYQRGIRAGQVERAKKLIETNPTRLKKANSNDFKRFILKTNTTKDGEVAEKETLSINVNVIAQEEIFDGFYAVCTNLDDDPANIIKINHRRWEIESCFRIMKSEFKARPVYLKRDDRIEAHFLTCFISLLLFRILEGKLDHRFTCHQIITQLRDMNFFEIPGEGYIPCYTRTDLTDALHELFGFRTDFQFIHNSSMKNIFRETKT